ncbi:MAG: hypothetical protein M3Y82_06320, partial [Verrucomicrobiota bacterium]|nr:hypothetical protein [Verrucomicrobiota bacterium]
ASAKPLYENNFEKAVVGKVPEDFLVLDGGFTVREENGNKFLELPGAPLETFGVLFGPTESTNISVTAKIFGTAKGRRFPTFAVGLNGVGGYKLQVSPAKKELELYRGDEVVAHVPCDWQTGKWTMLQLENRSLKEGGNKIAGKIWTEKTLEPKEMISFAEKSPLPAGRASVWGAPYSGTPIQFDDLKISRPQSSEK